MVAGWSLKREVESRLAGIICWWHASFVCVIYDTVRGYISTKISFLGGVGVPNYRPPTVPLGLRPCDMKHFKTKTVWHLPSLAHCEVIFFNNFTLYLYYTIQRTTKPSSPSMVRVTCDAQERGAFTWFKSIPYLKKYWHVLTPHEPWFNRACNSYTIHMLWWLITLCEGSNTYIILSVWQGKIVKNSIWAHV